MVVYLWESGFLTPFLGVFLSFGPLAEATLQGRFEDVAREPCKRNWGRYSFVFLVGLDYCFCLFRWFLLWFVWRMGMFDCFSVFALFWICLSIWFWLFASVYRIVSKWSVCKFQVHIDLFAVCRKCFIYEIPHFGLKVVDLPLHCTFHNSSTCIPFCNLFILYTTRNDSYYHLLVDHVADQLQHFFPGTALRFLDMVGKSPRQTPPRNILQSGKKSKLFFFWHSKTLKTWAPLW